MKIVPADATIADLEKKAAEYEEKAKTELNRIATRLREKAKLCREAASGSPLSKVGNGCPNRIDGPRPFRDC